MKNIHVEGQNRDFFYMFNRFFYEKGIFQRLEKGHTEEFKGLQVAHGWLNKVLLGFTKYLLLTGLFEKYTQYTLLIVTARFQLKLPTTSASFKKQKKRFIFRLANILC
jgi:hypothetical protein